MNLTIKICGLRDPENIIGVAALKPDFMGFIFSADSPRFAGTMLDPEIMTRIPATIRKTGVFVNTPVDEIKSTVNRYSLDAVQLHGNEAPEVCQRLKIEGLIVIKVFNLGSVADLGACNEYAGCTDYFLFDTKGERSGGSGIKFNWNILDFYTLDQPFILSGGIGPGDSDALLSINHPWLAGIDLNSRFEKEPGMKDIEKLRQFIKSIREN